MALQETLARYNTLSINTGGELAEITTSTVTEGDDPPIWTPIRRLMTFDTTGGKTEAATTNFDNAGWSSHAVVERDLSISLSYQYAIDPDTGTRDAGQAALEAKARITGPGAKAQYRWGILENGGGTEVAIFEASSDFNGPGGGVNDVVAPGITLHASGPVYYGVDPS